MALTPHFANALRDIEHMLGGLPGTLMPAVFNRGGLRYPTTDMIETKDAYELHAEVPGFDKKDIQVEVPDSHTIVLKGAMKQERKMEPPTTESSGKQEGTTEGTSDTQQVTKTATDKDKQVAQASDGRQWWVQERMFLY